MASLENARATFVRGVNESEIVVANVEALWQTAPVGSDVRRQIGERELSALYEMAFLSAFAHWESFVEECLIRMMTGQCGAGYTPVMATGHTKQRSLKAARAKILDGRRYLLWHDPVKAAERVDAYVLGSPLSGMLTANAVTLSDYASIRHAIAHKGGDVTDRFHEAAHRLTGVAHPSPGRMLRQQSHADPLNPVRWIRVATSQLIALAGLAVA